MGSEGCGGVKVSSNKVDDTSARVNSSIERCSNSISKKGVGNSSGASDLSSWRKLMHSHDFVHDRLTKLQIANSTEASCQPLVSPECGEYSRKRGKLSRSSSSNGFSKRTKLIKLEDVVNISRENDTKDIFGQGSANSVKQRNSFNGRRGEKRSSKVLTRTFSTVSPVTGENAFFGAYGLKVEINDVSKHVEDLSLDKLLEGSYKCPSLSKDKMKKSENDNSNDSLMSVVRNVWSILPTRRKPLQSQTSTELDRTQGSPSSISATLNGEINDRVNALDGDISSSSKVEILSETPSTPLNFPLCEANDVLQRLGLPPPKDLDSLLQDASKPSQNSKNNNSDQQRSAKQLPPLGVGIPHFPWSQAFNGSSKTNSEAAKLLTCKTLCQGRWLRVPDTTTSVTNQFANLESLTFNQSLVHHSNTTSCHCKEASVSTIVPTGKNAEPEGSKDVKDEALSCPHLRAAAQTLCDFATKSGDQNNNTNGGILRWPKKLSHEKSMKARKTKLIEKPPERRRDSVLDRFMARTMNSTTKLIEKPPEKRRRETVLDRFMARTMNITNMTKVPVAELNHHPRPKPPKRLKLSTMENKKGSFPSSSSSFAIDQSDRKHSSSSSKFKNHSRLMPPPPPPTRTLQKSSTYPLKTRKFQ